MGLTEMYTRNVYSLQSIVSRSNPQTFPTLFNRPCEAGAVLNTPSSFGYYSFALSTFAPVKFGTFAQKMTHLPRDFINICSKNGIFAPVKKGTFEFLSFVTSWVFEFCHNRIFF